MASPAQLVAKQRSYLGYREGPNNATDFGTWIGAPNAAWCDSFQHFCAYQVGLRFPGSQFGSKGDASVGYTIAWHKARGLWSSTPVDGAMVTYDWGGRGNWLEYHIELLVAHDAKRNLVIGGNVGDGVVEQWRSRFAVTGYCVLPYTAAPPAPIVAPKPVPVDLEGFLMALSPEKQQELANQVFNVHEWLESPALEARIHKVVKEELDAFGLRLADWLDTDKDGKPGPFPT